MEEFDSFQAVEMNELNISYGRTKSPFSLKYQVLLVLLSHCKCENWLYLSSGPSIDNEYDNDPTVLICLYI